MRKLELTFHLRLLLATAAIPVLYILAYVFMLSPSIHRLEVPDPHSDVVATGTLRIAEYRFGGDFAKSFFRPVCEIDRHVRPNYWSDWGVR